MKEYIENICRKYARNENFNGVCRFEQRGEVVFEKAYGYAERSFRVKNKLSTRFDTASVTKTFTAAAILQLVQAGKLSLDAYITDIADLEGTKIPRDVTVAQLLNHTSGIADDADEEAGEDYAALFADSPNYKIRECADFLENFAYKEPNFKAGTDVRYCNCAYVLLGLAIEAASGKSYRDYVAENVFAPAKMNRSGFFSTDGVEDEVAVGYASVYDEDDNFSGYKKNIYSMPPRGTPDGGAHTTAADLCAFMNAVKFGRLLDADMTRTFLSPNSPFSREVEWFDIPSLREVNGYAFEFLVFGGDTDKPFCIYKDGCADGVCAMLAYYPEIDATLVLLANTDTDVWDMRTAIQHELWQRYYK